MKNFWKIFLGAIVATGAVMTYAVRADDIIILTKTNHLAFHEVFTESSVADLEVKALALSAEAKAGDTVYLYLDTPGGDVVAGENMIHFLKSLPQNVKPIVNFAASMGFITAESLGDRYILPSGILMSHRATVGVEGQLPGEANVRLAFWGNHIKAIETRMAARMGLSEEAYEKKIYNEYWVTGQAAVDDKAADKVVSVRCASDLTGTYDTEVQTIFGPVTVTYSECPLISAPLAIKFGSEGKSTDYIAFKQAITEAFMNKLSFVQNAQIHQAYYHYVR